MSHKESNRKDDHYRIKKEERDERYDKEKYKDKEKYRDDRDNRDNDSERDRSGGRNNNRNSSYSRDSRDSERRSYKDKIKSEFERDGDKRKRSRSPTSPRSGRRYEKYEKKDDITHRPPKRSNYKSPPEEQQVWGKREKESGEKKEEEEEEEKKEQPNFEPSGLLNQEAMTVNGVVVKYDEPAESRTPMIKWLLYPFKGEQSLDPIPIHRSSFYLFGRERAICDIPIDHPSCSKQHSVLQFREVVKSGKRKVLPYIIDLESTNGTFVNGTRVTPAQYYELREKDVLKFGFSTREYVLLHEGSGITQESSDSDEV